jgi:DNA-binding MarR family transcriptional regulator
VLGGIGLILTDFLAGAVAGGAAVVAGRLVLERLRDRRAVVVPPAPVLPASTPDRGPAPVTQSAAPPPRMEIVVAPSPPPSASGPSEMGEDEEPLRTSQRVILHILRQGRLGPNELSPVGLSQAGIGAALGIRQSSLAKALARLVAAGVLSVGRRHVEHQVRRLKVYELTPLGEALARDLRRRTTRPTVPGTPRDVGPIRLGR